MKGVRVRKKREREGDQRSYLRCPRRNFRNCPCDMLSQDLKAPGIRSGDLLWPPLPETGWLLGLGH